MDSNAEDRRLSAAADNSDGGTMAQLRKRGRRVSFAAEMTSVHFFDRDDEESGDKSKVETGTESGSSEQLEKSKEFEGEEDNDDDEGDEINMPRLIFPVVGSPSPGGSSVCSASSNDENDFFGPVAPNFIRPGRLSDSAASDENHDVTMDETTFSMHYRSLARSELGVDLKTPTAGQLFFEDKTPTTSRGSSMIFTLGEKPIPKFDVPVTEVSGSHDSNDMSLVGDNRNKFNYEKHSPGLDAILAETQNLLASVSDDIIASKSPKRMENEVLPSTQHEDMIVDGVILNNTGDANSTPRIFGNGHSPKAFSSSSTADCRPDRSPHQLRNNESEGPFVAAASVLTRRQILPVIASPSNHLVPTPPQEQSSSVQRYEYIDGHESEKSIQRSISKLDLLEKSALSSGFKIKVDSSIKLLDFARSPNFSTFSGNKHHVSKINLLEDSVTEDRLSRVYQIKENIPDFRIDGSRAVALDESLGETMIGELPNDSNRKNSAVQPDNRESAASSPKFTWSQNDRKRSLFTSRDSNEDILTTKTDSLLAEIASVGGGNVVRTTPNFISPPIRRLDKKVLASPRLQSSPYEDPSLHNPYEQFSNINNDKYSTPERDLVSVDLSAADAIGETVSIVLKGQMNSPTVEINCLKNLTEVKENDGRELKLNNEKGVVGTMDNIITSDKHKALLVMHSKTLDVGDHISRHDSCSGENQLLGESRNVSPVVCRSRDEPRLHNNLVELPIASPSPEEYLTKQISVTPSPENCSAKKRNVELLLMERQHQIEMTTMQRSPKLQKGEMYDSTKLSNFDGGSNRTTSNEKMQWTDVLMIQSYSKFLEDMEQLISRSAGKLNNRMIDLLEDMLDHQQRSQTYELLRYGLENKTDLHDLQSERIAEASRLLYRVVFGKVKLMLQHVKRERLLKRSQLLSARIQESQILETKISLQLKTCVTNDLVHAVDNQSANLNLKKGHEVSQEKLTSMRQSSEALDKKIMNLKNTFHACCKIKAEPSCDEIIALVNEQLVRRAHCRSVRQDMQMWVVHSLRSLNCQHDVVLNYLDFIFQSIKVLVGPTSSATISFKLNETNINKNFPNMDACIAFALIFSAETIHKYVGAKMLALETQVTSLLLGSLLDVIEEVQSAHLDFNNLIQSRFCSSPVEQLRLMLCFFNFRMGSKVILTLDLSCLKRGIYPSDILPLSIDIPKLRITEPILGDINDAVKGVRTGYMRIFRLCKCISEALVAAST